MKSGSSPLVKLFRILAYGVGGVIVLAGLGMVTALTIAHTRITRVHTFQAAAIAIPSDATSLDRGRHIAVTRGCTDCHGKDFAGNKVVDDAAMGKFYGPNLTHGKGGLSADYADMDYVRAIRHGVTRAGRSLLLMPSYEYSQLSDEDLGSLVAYLKSLPAVDRERGPVKPGPLARVLIAAGEIKIAADEIDHALKRPVSVPVGATAEYGRYLSASCTGCHGENLSGGKIPGVPPDWPKSANLTPREGTGMSMWSEKDFVGVMRTLKRPDGSAMSPVMPVTFGKMTDQELTALYLYLKTLPSMAAGQR